jgi:hypothetical protein
MGKKHASWDFFKDYHQGEKPGCVWIHSGGWGDTACHYAMNGYKASKSRLDMYNKDHRQVAKDQRYVFDDSQSGGGSTGSLRLSNRIGRQVASAASRIQASKAARASSSTSRPSSRGSRAGSAAPSSG